MNAVHKPPYVPRLEEAGVLIAGGTSGVGLASALAFAAAGVPRIALIGRNVERGERARNTVAKQHPRTQVSYIAADANKPKQALAAAETAKEALGQIDVLVNATVGPYTPILFHEIPPEDIEEILVQQALGPMLMCRAVVPGMRARHGGAIINISSDAGKVVTPGESVLGAAMAAIIMFSKALANEIKRSGIRVNVLTPSLIEGTLTYDRVMSDTFSAKLFKSAVAQAHLGVVQPDDLAELVVFLAGPQGARITGQTISVNGGISIA